MDGNRGSKSRRSTSSLSSLSQRSSLNNTSYGSISNLNWKRAHGPEHAPGTSSASESDDSNDSEPTEEAPVVTLEAMAKSRRRFDTTKRKRKHPSPKAPVPVRAPAPPPLPQKLINAEIQKKKEKEALQKKLLEGEKANKLSEKERRQQRKEREKDRERRKQLEREKQAALLEEERLRQKQKQKEREKKRREAEKERERRRALKKAEQEKQRVLAGDPGPSGTSNAAALGEDVSQLAGTSRTSSEFVGIDPDQPVCSKSLLPSTAVPVSSMSVVDTSTEVRNLAPEYDLPGTSAVGASELQTPPTNLVSDTAPEGPSHAKELFTECRFNSLGLNEPEVSDNQREATHSQGGVPWTAVQDFTSVEPALETTHFPDEAGASARTQTPANQHSLPPEAAPSASVLESTGATQYCHSGQLEQATVADEPTVSQPLQTSDNSNEMYNPYGSDHPMFNGQRRAHSAAANNYDPQIQGQFFSPQNPSSLPPMGPYPTPPSYYADQMQDSLEQPRSHHSATGRQPASMEAQHIYPVNNERRLSQPSMHAGTQGYPTASLPPQQQHDSLPAYNYHLSNPPSHADSTVIQPSPHSQPGSSSSAFQHLAAGQPMASSYQQTHPVHYPYHQVQSDTAVPAQPQQSQYQGQQFRQYQNAPQNVQGFADSTVTQANYVRLPVTSPSNQLGQAVVVHQRSNPLMSHSYPTGQPEVRLRSPNQTVLIRPQTAPVGSRRSDGMEFSGPQTRPAGPQPYFVRSQASMAPTQMRPILVSPPGMAQEVRPMVDTTQASRGKRTRKQRRQRSPPTVNAPAAVCYPQLPQPQGLQQPQSQPIQVQLVQQYPGQAVEQPRQVFISPPGQQQQPLQQVVLHPNFPGSVNVDTDSQQLFHLVPAKKRFKLRGHDASFVRQRAPMPEMVRYSVARRGTVQPTGFPVMPRAQPTSATVGNHPQLSNLLSSPTAVTRPRQQMPVLMPVVMEPAVSMSTDQMQPGSSSQLPYMAVQQQNVMQALQRQPATQQRYQTSVPQPVSSQWQEIPSSQVLYVVSSAAAKDSAVVSTYTSAVGPFPSTTLSSQDNAPYMAEAYYGEYQADYGQHVSAEVSQAFTVQSVSGTEPTTLQASQQPYGGTVRDTCVVSDNSYAMDYYHQPPQPWTYPTGPCETEPDALAEGASQGPNRMAEFVGPGSGGYEYAVGGSEPARATGETLAALNSFDAHLSVLMAAEGRPRGLPSTAHAQESEFVDPSVSQMESVPPTEAPAAVANPLVENRSLDSEEEMQAIIQRAIAPPVYPRFIDPDDYQDVDDMVDPLLTQRSLTPEERMPSMSPDEPWPQFPPPTPRRLPIVPSSRPAISVSVSEPQETPKDVSEVESAPKAAVSEPVAVEPTVLPEKEPIAETSAQTPTTPEATVAVVEEVVVDTMSVSQSVVKDVETIAPEITTPISRRTAAESDTSMAESVPTQPLPGDTECPEAVQSVLSPAIEAALESEASESGVVATPVKSVIESLLDSPHVETQPEIEVLDSTAPLSEPTVDAPFAMHTDAVVEETLDHIVTTVVNEELSLTMPQELCEWPGTDRKRKVPDSPKQQKKSRHESPKAVEHDENTLLESISVHETTSCTASDAHKVVELAEDELVSEVAGTSATVPTETDKENEDEDEVLVENTKGELISVRLSRDNINDLVERGILDAKVLVRSVMCSTGIEAALTLMLKYQTRLAYLKASNRLAVKRRMTEATLLNAMLRSIELEARQVAKEEFVTVAMGQLCYIGSKTCPSELETELLQVLKVQIATRQWLKKHFPNMNILVQGPTVTPEFRLQVKAAVEKTSRTLSIALYRGMLAVELFLAPRYFPTVFKVLADSKTCDGVMEEAVRLLNDLIDVSPTIVMVMIHNAGQITPDQKALRALYVCSVRILDSADEEERARIFVGWNDILDKFLESHSEKNCTTAGLRLAMLMKEHLSNLAVKYRQNTVTDEPWDSLNQEVPRILCKLLHLTDTDGEVNPSVLQTVFRIAYRSNFMTRLMRLMDDCDIEERTTYLRKVMPVLFKVILMKPSLWSEKRDPTANEAETLTINYRAFAEIFKITMQCERSVAKKILKLCSDLYDDLNKPECDQSMLRSAAGTRDIKLRRKTVRVKEDMCDRIARPLFEMLDLCYINNLMPVLLTRVKRPPNVIPAPSSPFSKVPRKIAKEAEARYQKRLFKCTKIIWEAAKSVPITAKMATLVNSDFLTGTFDPTALLSPKRETTGLEVYVRLIQLFNLDDHEMLVKFPEEPLEYWDEQRTRCNSIIHGAIVNSCNRMFQVSDAKQWDVGNDNDNAIAKALEDTFVERHKRNQESFVSDAITTYAYFATFLVDLCPQLMQQFVRKLIVACEVGEDKTCTKAVEDIQADLTSSMCGIVSDSVTELLKRIRCGERFPRVLSTCLSDQQSGLVRLRCLLFEITTTFYDPTKLIVAIGLLLPVQHKLRQYINSTALYSLAGFNKGDPVNVQTYCHYFRDHLWGVQFAELGLVLPAILDLFNYQSDQQLYMLLSYIYGLLNCNNLDVGRLEIALRVAREPMLMRMLGFTGLTDVPLCHSLEMDRCDLLLEYIFYLDIKLARTEQVQNRSAKDNFSFSDCAYIHHFLETEYPELVRPFRSFMTERVEQVVTKDPKPRRRRSLSCSPALPDVTHRNATRSRELPYFFNYEPIITTK